MDPAAYFRAWGVDTDYARAAAACARPSARQPPRQVAPAAAQGQPRSARASARPPAGSTARELKHRGVDDGRRACSYDRIDDAGLHVTVDGEHRGRCRSTPSCCAPARSRGANCTRSCAPRGRARAPDRRRRRGRRTGRQARHQPGHRAGGDALRPTTPRQPPPSPPLPRMQPMSLPHAILTALLEKPSSGLELTRRFDRSIGYFWSATHQQIYRELGKLEAGDTSARCPPSSRPAGRRRVRGPARGPRGAGPLDRRGPGPEAATRPAAAAAARRGGRRHRRHRDRPAPPSRAAPAAVGRVRGDRGARFPARPRHRRRTGCGTWSCARASTWRPSGPSGSPTHCRSSRDCPTKRRERPVRGGTRTGRSQAVVPQSSRSRRN